MGLLSKLFGKQGTNDFSGSEEYNKLVSQFGKQKTDEIISYWIQYYYMNEELAKENRIDMDVRLSILMQVTEELDRRKGREFAKTVAFLKKYCDEKKLAEEINAFKLFDQDKEGKYHWVKDTIRI